MERIKNRKEAGIKLAEKLKEFVKDKKIKILAVARGGVVVGKEIAKKYKIPLDVIVSKKITPPSMPEYAIGAVTHDGMIYHGPNWNKFSREANFVNELMEKSLETKRRIEEYRSSSVYKFDNDDTIILVDDGIATGATIFVLIKWLSEQNIGQLILAVPVIPMDTFKKMESIVDSIITLNTPTEFYSVGEFYKEFEQVSDKEVIDILSKLK